MLTATLIIPASGSVISFPSVPTTAKAFSTTTKHTTIESSFRTTHSLTTASVTTSHRAKSSSTSVACSYWSSRRSSTRRSHLSTATSTVTSSTQTANVTSAAAAANGGGNETSGSLDKGQVVGISVGVTAAAAVALGVIVLARYYRRRKRGSVFGFVPLGDSKSNKKQDRDSDSWIAYQIRSPLNPNPPPPPTAYNPSSWRPDTIGLAVSPPPRRDGMSRTPNRPMSKLLPEKLDLSLSWPRGYSAPENKAATLQVPSIPPRLASFEDRNKPQPPPPLNLHIPRETSLMQALPAQTGRESMMTEFEEDGAGQLESSRIWRPPSALPPSDAPYYVADKHGNWVLRDPRRSRDPAQKESSARSGNDFRPTVEAAGPGEILPQTRDQAPAVIAPTYHNLPLFSNPHQSHSNLLPPLFVSAPNPQPAPKTVPYKTRAASTDSDVTVFSTSSDDMNDPSPPEEPPSNLSPVAESPHPGGGVSPVTYPKIHDRVPSSAAAAPVRPPPRSSMRPPRSNQAPYFPPGQPSPTLGMMRPPPPTARGPYSAPPRGRPPYANPAAVRTGSPSVRMLEPSPEPDDRSRLPSAQQRGPYPAFVPNRTSFQRASGNFQPPQAPPYPSFSEPSRQISNRYPPFPVNPSRPPPQPTNTRYLQPVPSQVPRSQEGPPHPPPAPFAGGNRPSTPELGAPAGSLLQKRLGTDRAANMTLPTDTPSHEGKWKRKSSLSAAAGPATPKRPDGTPATPTWMTPTRRGDDLFLSVQ